MNQTIESPKWWLDLARFSLKVTIGVVFTCIMSFLAAKTSFFGSPDLGGLIVFGFYFILSLYASLGLALLALIGIVTGFFIKYPLKEYVIIFVISLIPILFFDAVL